MSVKLAIIGGSFNPIHIGHLVLAESVLTQLGYDKVLFVPAFYPPHKKLSTVGVLNEDRLAMVKLAIHGNSAFGVETCEFDRQGISYTIDTVNYLYEKYEKYENTGSKSVNDSSICGRIGIIIGDDLTEGFNKWKNADILAQKTDIIVAQRDSQTDSFGLQHYPHLELKNAILPVSSNEIRAAIQQNKAWRYLVTPEVYNYIKAKNLYVKRNEANN